MALTVSDRFYGFNRETRKISSSYHKLLKDPSIREDMTSFKGPGSCNELMEVADLRVLSSQDILQTESEREFLKIDPNEKPNKFWNKLPRTLQEEDAEEENPEQAKTSTCRIPVDSCLLALSITLILIAILDMCFKAFDVLSFNVIHATFLTEQILLHTICMSTIARNPMKMAILVPYMLTEFGISLGYCEQQSLENCRIQNDSSFYNRNCRWFTILFNSSAWISLITVVGTLVLLLVLIYESVTAKKTDEPTNKTNQIPNLENHNPNSSSPPQSTGTSDVHHDTQDARIRDDFSSFDLQ